VFGGVMIQDIKCGKNKTKFGKNRVKIKQNYDLKK
jgi:hypothetical protein